MRMPYAAEQMPELRQGMGYHDMTPDAAAICKDIQKLLETAGGGKFGLRTIFDDFTTIAMASFHNMLYSIGGRAVPGRYRATRDKLEDDYERTIKKYEDTNGYDVFAGALAQLALAMNADPFDYLGTIFMNANLGNAGHGQFFTPFHIAELMTHISLGNREAVEQKITEQGYIGMADPCCGSGVFAIAMAKVLGSDYGIRGLHSVLRIRLTDIDYGCVKMAFVNMALLGLSARIVWGDALTNADSRIFDTPNLQAALQNAPQVAEKSQQHNTGSRQYGQLTLF